MWDLYETTLSFLSYMPVWPSVVIYKLTKMRLQSKISIHLNRYLKFGIKHGESLLYQMVNKISVLFSKKEKRFQYIKTQANYDHPKKKKKQTNSLR